MVANATQNEGIERGPSLAKSMAMGVPLTDLSADELKELAASKDISRELLKALHKELDGREAEVVAAKEPEQEMARQAEVSNPHEALDKRLDLHSQSVAYRETGIFFANVETAEAIAQKDVGSLSAEILETCKACGHKAVDGTAPAANTREAMQVDGAAIAFTPDAAGAAQRDAAMQRG